MTEGLQEKTEKELPMQPVRNLACFYNAKRGVLASMILCLSVAACSSSIDAYTNLRPDHSITTGSVSPAAVASSMTEVDENILEDEPLILNALVADSSPNAHHSWINLQNGVQGELTVTQRRQEEGRTCVDFKTTRESFDGVNLYQGVACEVRAGMMRIRKLFVQ